MRQLLARIADQLHAEQGVSRKGVWDLMQAHARMLGVTRDIFSITSEAPVRGLANPSRKVQVYAGDRAISERLKRLDDEVRSGKRAPDSLALLSRAMVRNVRILPRPDAVDEGTASW